MLSKGRGGGGRLEGVSFPLGGTPSPASLVLGLSLSGKFCLPGSDPTGPESQSKQTPRSKIGPAPKAQGESIHQIRLQVPKASALKIVFSRSHPTFCWHRGRMLCGAGRPPPHNARNHCCQRLGRTAVDTDQAMKAVELQMTA